MCYLLRFGTCPFRCGRGALQRHKTDLNVFDDADSGEVNGSFGNVGRGKEAKSSKILRHRPEVRLVGHDFVSQVVHLGHGFGLEEDGAVLA